MRSTLPTYHRFVNGVPQSSSRCKSFRPRKKYLFLFLIPTIILVCFGTIFVLPVYLGTAGKPRNVYKNLWGEIGAKGSRGIRTVPPATSDRYPNINNVVDLKGDVAEKRETVKRMMKHAWNNYVQYAWGENELSPVSKQGHSSSVFGSAHLGASIVDSLDTLYIMGLMDEYNAGRNWVAINLDVEGIDSELSVFETNIRFIGGLLTCFTLTGDVLFRDKAQQFADKLLPAFQTPTGIPKAKVNFKTGSSRNYGWLSWLTGGVSFLADIGTLHLEFSYLSDVTGNPLYKSKVDRIRHVLKEAAKPKGGLYPIYISPITGKWGQHVISMGAIGDSFYEYLLKSWIQSDKKDIEARHMYDDAMQSVLEHLLQTSRGGSNLMYFATMKYGQLEHKMDHLACFSAGMLALGAKSLPNELSARYMEVAEGIANTCHESYDRTPTKLGPESFEFTNTIEAIAIKSSDKHYILRPEVVETYFIMYRLTKNEKYRQWGWEAVQALEKYCRVPGGYSGLEDVYTENPSLDDIQQSFLLAETLKYLFLLFSDDSVMSLDDWVFNTEAHPLPIKNVNPYYRDLLSLL